MRYCKRCVQPDSRPNIKFDDEGVCGGCRYEESKLTIDWTAREKELQDIVEWAKSNKTNSYDCVIGISGGKDSHFQALYAKEKLKLNPLLVCNKPDGRTDVGTHNIENLRSYGFDLIEISPDPEVMRALTKRDFIKYSNLVKSSEYSLWSSAYRVAVEKKIPLVIQGENPALIFGLSDGVSGGDALTIKNNNTIDGCNADDLVITEEEAKYYQCMPVPREKLDMFDFPSDIQLDGIKGIFLQYYAKEWGQNHNTRFARNHGLMGRYSESLFDIGRTYRETSVDGDHLLVNQYLKYLKFGFGYETDAQCYNIRELGETRENAIKYVKMYDHCCAPKYIKGFCNYIGITVNDFYLVVDKFVNKKLFYLDRETNQWKPKFTVGVDYNV
jgi:N-acetyl sugar amidotransferase